MEQSAQFGIIRSEGNSSGELRRRKAAERTLSNTMGGGKAGGFQIESVAAARAEGFASRGHAVKAGVTDLADAKVEHRSTAEAAIRRKEEVDKVGRSRLRAISEDAHCGAPASCSAPRRLWGSELYVPQAAAEDGPHPWHKQKKLQLCRWLKYSPAAKIGQLPADENPAGYTGWYTHEFGRGMVRCRL
jgi:hypothetical protein